jgi:hypothetical protein
MPQWEHVKMWLFKRKQKYGHPGDSRDTDLMERRKLQAQWLETELAKRENEVRIARIEGMAQVLSGLYQGSGSGNANPSVG